MKTFEAENKKTQCNNRILMHILSALEPGALCSKRLTHVFLNPDDSLPVIVPNLPHIALTIVIGNLPEWKGDHTRLPEQMKYELAESSGSQAIVNSLLHCHLQMVQNRGSRGKKK